ncbi:hypothetical protein RIR_jg27107.t1 [Rhizophagus irregularis DAOM 181602=DAOM 197198]|nr:hypothetical protein RhiirB3_454385 [Rhizophagus irregularis]GET58077.1 hypothetical protein RIR_jg27107.t1 [Rhizophagus irregularis DAOM 181602=DAOM 197198]
MPNLNKQLKLPNIIKTMLHQSMTITNKVLVNKKPGILTKRLATELGEVKKVVDNDFVRMFIRKRNTLLETMIPLWQQIYEPTGKFKETIESTIEKITKEE